MFVRSDAMLCSITRIKAKKFITLIRVIFSYFRMKRQARHISGLLEVSMLLKKERTVIFISLWQNSDAMAHFATVVQEHSSAVRKMYGTTEFWSGIFALEKMSPKMGRWADASVKTVHTTIDSSDEVQNNARLEV